MKPVIDTGKCSGHGRCYSLAPEIFDCDDEGFSVLLVERVEGPDLEHKLLEAVANCPERAISVAEEA